MAIFEVRSTVTLKSLMRKSKWDLAHDYLTLLDFCGLKEKKRLQYEKFMLAVCEILEEKPNFSDPTPDGGNQHVINRLREVLDNEERL